SKREETYSLDLKDMYCNVKDSNKILKVNITIETNNKNTVEVLSEKVYLIRDEINQIIRNKTEDELKGREGQVNLQNDIREALIRIFKDEAITNVYFNDFVMQ
ncbi:MAG: flagellar basal body-associated FliL family protein, partial [Tissierellales bacterium]